MTRFSSRMVPLLMDDVDTDQIIPARYLKVTDKLGLGDALFADWKYRADGSLDEQFALNRKESQGAAVLLAGVNFGCGSSREHAPWALVGWGLRAVVARSFADIFKNNALKNRLLPIEVSADVHAALARLVASNPSAEIHVDLESCTVRSPDGTSCAFAIDPFARECLLRGVDELGYLLSKAADIESHERRNG